MMFCYQTGQPITVWGDKPGVGVFFANNNNNINKQTSKQQWKIAEDLNNINFYQGISPHSKS